MNLGWYSANLGWCVGCNPTSSLSNCSVLFLCVDLVVDVVCCFTLCFLFYIFIHHLSSHIHSFFAVFLTRRQYAFLQWCLHEANGDSGHRRKNELAMARTYGFHAFPLEWQMRERLMSPRRSPLSSFIWVAVVSIGRIGVLGHDLYKFGSRWRFLFHFIFIVSVVVHLRLWFETCW